MDFTAILIALAKVGGTLLTWILVVSGWRVVSEFQDRRERTKARLAHLLELRKAAKEIEAEAVAFHTSSSHEETRARKITRAFKLLTVELRHLQKVGVLDSSWPRLIMEARQAATAKNFDRSTFNQQGLSDESVLGIEATIDKLDEYFLTSVGKLLDQTGPELRWRDVLSGFRFSA